MARGRPAVAAFTILEFARISPTLHCDMSESPPAASLSADAALRLAEFSRVCKAAARAVSLYPGGHPAIGVSLTRLEQATARLTEAGPYSLQVVADGLLLDGARLAKPDPAVTELAALLHRHLVGRLTLNAGATADSWRTLMLLLARAPEEVRADGGLARLWATAGGPSLEIVEVDYAEVLREKQGLAATIDSILAAAMSGPTLTVDEAALKALLEIVEEPHKLEQLMRQLEETAAKSPQGVELQTATLLNMVRGLADYVSRTDPQESEHGVRAVRPRRAASLGRGDDRAPRRSACGPKRCPAASTSSAR